LAAGRCGRTADEFIRYLRRRVKQDDPEGVLLARSGRIAPNKYGPEGRRGYVDGDELDSAMNYVFTEAMVAFLTVIRTRMRSIMRCRPSGSITRGRFMKPASI
jgi:hypothetical protein